MSLMRDWRVFRASVPREEEFICPCGYRRWASVPSKITFAEWLRNYPCPDCRFVVHPSVFVAPKPVSEEAVLDQAVRAVLSALAEPGVTTVADVAQALRLHPDMLRPALARLRGVGLLIPEVEQTYLHPLHVWHQRRRAQSGPLPGHGGPVAHDVHVSQPQNPGDPQ